VDEINASYDVYLFYNEVFHGEGRNFISQAEYSSEGTDEKDPFDCL
jgi:hypothetical protein